MILSTVLIFLTRDEFVNIFTICGVELKQIIVIRSCSVGEGTK